MVQPISSLYLVSFVESSLMKSYLLNKFENFVKVYKFKIFKKTTRFKRYSVGPTKYIINRKRYHIRKKRNTSLQNYYISSIWSSNYKKKAQLVKYNQLTCLFTSTSLIINKNYVLKKVLVLQNTPLNTASLPLGLLCNRSLFNPTTKRFDSLFYKNSLIGFVYRNRFGSTHTLLKSQPFNNVFYGSGLFKESPKELLVSVGALVNQLSYLLLRKSIYFAKVLYMLIITLSLLCLNN